MSVEVRIKAEMDKTVYEPKENGSITREIEIAGDGLNMDEVRSHRWVEDAIMMDNGDFKLYVSSESNRAIYST